MACNEEIDLTGATTQDLAVDYKNTLEYTFSLQDEEEVVINLENSSLALEIYKDKNYSEQDTIDGVLADNFESVTFKKFIELPKGTYYYRVLWTDADANVFTVLKGNLNVK